MGWYTGEYASPILQLGDIPEEIAGVLSPVQNVQLVPAGMQAPQLRRVYESKTLLGMADRLQIPLRRGEILDEIDVKTIVVQLLGGRLARVRRIAEHWRRLAQRRGAERVLCNVTCSDYIPEHIPAYADSVDGCSEIPEDLTHFAASVPRRAAPPSALQRSFAAASCNNNAHVCSPLTTPYGTPCTAQQSFAAACAAPPSPVSPTQSPPRSPSFAQAAEAAEDVGAADAGADADSSADDDAGTASQPSPSPAPAEPAAVQAKRAPPPAKRREGSDRSPAKRRERPPPLARDAANAKRASLPSRFQAPAMVPARSERRHFSTPDNVRKLFCET